MAPLIILTAMVASACTGTSHHVAGQTGTSRTTRPSTATTTTAPDPKAAVLAAYQDYWKLWLDDNDPPNPDDPRLSRVETGQQLAGTVQAIAQMRLRGQIVRLPAHSIYHHDAIATVAATGTTATVRDCSVDDSVISVEATGAVVDGKVETQLITATLVLLAGKWKVNNTSFLMSKEGLTTCPPS